MPHNAMERKALLLIMKIDYQRRPIFTRFAKKMTTRCRDRKSESFYPQTICSLLEKTSAAVVSCYHYAIFQIQKYLQGVPTPSVCK